ncbi:MAG: methylated-DNA--[protein]-cysteine S-methyltransferase [Chloroflexi bacterium]|nr:methylated-DNA--[protein]-cysteine S-methyltransferase [Chloroflexota bacterium]
MTYYRSPIGLIKITSSAKGIASLYFVDAGTPSVTLPDCLREGVSQLDEYFNHTRTEFSLALDLRGTDFQKRVWGELLKIPFGKTISYRDMAIALGDRNALRAVGSANGQNPISIIVPCHRVIGSDGSLTGYGGGLWRKEWLLNFEGVLGVRVMNAPSG